MSEETVEVEENEFKFFPASSFHYDHKGERVDAQYVLCTAPTSKHRKECAFLKQAFWRSLKDAPEGDEDSKTGAATPKKDKIEPEDVLILLAMSGNVDFGEALEVARRLLTGGVALVDGEEKLNGPLIDRLSNDDFERLIGEYLAFFPLRSSLRKLNDSSSD